MIAAPLVNRPSLRDPTDIKGHSWAPEDIRENPDAAFDLFDANHDGVISVAELLFTTRKTNEATRRRGSIFDEMKLFQLLDVDGNSVITRTEFCSVIQNPLAFTDDALGAIAQLATRRELMKLEEAKEIDDEAITTAVSAVLHGVEISRRNSERISDVDAPVEVCWEPKDDDIVRLELFAVGIKATEQLWYDIFGFYVTPDPYIVIAGDRGGRRVELATTTVRANTLNTSWTPVEFKAATLKGLDQPYTLRAELYNSVSKIRMGETARFDVPRLDNVEAALGPLHVFNFRDDVVAKLLGTTRWKHHIPGIPGLDAALIDNDRQSELWPNAGCCCNLSPQDFFSYDTSTRFVTRIDSE